MSPINGEVASSDNESQQILEGYKRVDIILFQVKLGCRGKKRGLPLTSEFLELVSVPTSPCRSSRIVLVPGLLESCTAVASPTAPPPIICESRWKNQHTNWHWTRLE